MKGRGAPSRAMPRGGAGVSAAADPVDTEEVRIMDSFRAGVGLGVSAAALLLGGCFGVGNVNYPPIAGQSAGDDLNQPAARNVMATALLYATNRYPPVADPQPGVEYKELLSFNLPPGVSDGTYRMVQDEVSQRNPLAVAYTLRTAGRPVYHVSRVMVRGTDASVDVLVPRYNLGVGTQGEQMYSGLTVDMRGGLRPWQVISARSFAVRAEEIPVLNPLPEEPTE